MSLVGIVALIAFGFGGGYKWKTDYCNKEGCPAVVVEAPVQAEEKLPTEVK